MLALFAWLAGMDIVAGALAWTIASLAMLLAASWMSARSRRELGLYPLPWTLVAGAVVLSTPMLFMLERGNTDIIVVAAIALAALALKQRGWGNDLLVALCIAVAAWTKVYPAMLVAALLPLRRTRAAVLSIAIIAAVGVLPWEWTLDWIHSARTGVAVNQLAPPSVFTHSIAGHWGHLAEALDLHAAAAVPGLVVAALVLVPLAAWVSWPISWKHSEPLAYPYLLWFAQVWTFALPSSYFDYKLIFMPLAMLAVWSPRDRLPIQLLFAPFLLYWQPVALPLASTALLPWVLLAIKVAALVAIGLMIRARTRELPAREA
jgi:hypothetical protein